jgi:hypothetical protein
MTRERWQHVIENHNDLADYYDTVLSTLEKPDLVISGYRGTLIAMRGIAKGRYLAVVYKELSRVDGFMISAYFTIKVDKKRKVWPL